MKRSFIILFFLCVSLFRVYAQDAIEILLDKDEVSKTIYGCNLTFTRGGTAGNSRVDIKIKNNSSDVVILFNRNYNEKELKKELKKKNRTFPSITYDKFYRGTKGVNSNYVTGLNDIVRLEQGSVANLPSQSISTIAKIRLPLYLGKYKGKKKSKLIINDFKDIPFVIRIPEQIDNDYPELLRRYEELNNNVKKASPFCNNPAHTESRKLEEKYQKDKEQIIAEINNKLVSVYGPTNINNYNNLYNKVQGIVFEERDCGRHKVASTTTKSVHHCAYCDKSLDYINNEIDGLYNKLRTGKISQSKAEDEAEKIISACNTRDCPLNAKWKKGGNIRKRIEGTYQDIKNFNK